MLTLTKSLQMTYTVWPPFILLSPSLNCCGSRHTGLLSSSLNVQAGFPVRAFALAVPLAWNALLAVGSLHHVLQVFVKMSPYQ